MVHTYTTTPLGTGVRLLSYCTPPRRAGRQVNLNAADYIATTAANAASPQTIASKWAFGAAQAWNAYLVLQDAYGLQSAPFLVRITAT